MQKLKENFLKCLSNETIFSSRLRQEDVKKLSNPDHLLFECIQIPLAHIRSAIARKIKWDIHSCNLELCEIFFYNSQENSYRENNGVNDEKINNKSTISMNKKNIMFNL